MHKQISESPSLAGLIGEDSKIAERLIHLLKQGTVPIEGKYFNWDEVREMPHQIMFARMLLQSPAHPRLPKCPRDEQALAVVAFSQARQACRALQCLLSPHSFLASSPLRLGDRLKYLRGEIHQVAVIRQDIIKRPPISRRRIAPNRRQRQDLKITVPRV